jgi:putative hydrolase of the HAD superfamily
MDTRRFVPHTVTFDCWQTLIYEEHPPARVSHAGRIEILAEVSGAPRERVAEAFAAAWHEHQRAWHRRMVFAGPEITSHALAALGVVFTPERQAALVRTLEDEVLSHQVHAIDGARELLQALRAAGVRTALICDTGFSPGRCVRQLLARVGLLEYLEVHVFSDEVGAPKPHLRPFRAALDGLGVAAEGSLHVGDLRRSDIAGALAAGMRAVRFSGRHDDAQSAGAGANVLDCRSTECDPVCPQPEAEAVIASYRELADYLSQAELRRPR